MEQTIIIGGGAIGLSLAYHLAQRKVDNVVLLERNQISSGTSWHAAGIVGPLRATPNMTQLAMYAGTLFPQLEKETGQSVGYKQTGGYWLARKPERMDELHRIAALGSYFGLSVEIETAEHCQHALPYLDLSQHIGSMRVAEDATVNPVDLCNAYAKGAKLGGVEIRENTSVVKILSQDSKVTGVELEDGTVISANKVALCCGAWSKQLADTAGVSLALQAVEHMYVVTEPVENIPQPFPVIRDLDTGIYIKGDAGGKLIIGGFEANAKCWDAYGPNGQTPFLELGEDWDQFTPFMHAALTLFPALESVGIAHFMNGPESFTTDTKPLVGETPQIDKLFVAAGMNSVGVMSSAGIGKALGDWMTDGQAPMNLWEVDIARTDPLASSTIHMHARMKEAVADQFDMHWPFKQPTAGRNLRVSCLHEKWQAKGAVFGLTAGWERGLWYAQHENEQALPYSTGEQAWFDIACREAHEMLHGTVLIDLTPFSKFDIKGRDALCFMEHLCCSNMDIEVGKISYTLLLNKEGGIENDVTVARYGDKHFRLTSGAATRWRDHALLRRASIGRSVHIDDVTEHEAVIGVMGQGARSLMESVTEPQDMQDFDFGTTRRISIGGDFLCASRISYVGELGWELNIENEHARILFDHLVNAGAKPMGHYAVDSCRIEKGFCHWGHDIGPDVSPLQAGLGFTIDWTKEFIGKSALLNEKARGITTKLCLFEVNGHALMLHDEPILESGTIIGLTTSGTRGVRTGLSLAFGLINVEPNETLEQTCMRHFEIQVAGTNYPARVLPNPPYDSPGTRMRA